jgi:hypothetical protein
MYPIDAIKVRHLILFTMVNSYTKTTADPNANPQPYPICSLQWHDTRRLPNSNRGGIPQFMARHVECGCRSRFVHMAGQEATNTDCGAGPAHAVYFATYEAVKHVMGGNQAGVHHPLAAGMLC